MTPGNFVQMPNGRHIWNGERWVPPWEWTENDDGTITMPAPAGHHLQAV